MNVESPPTTVDPKGLAQMYLRRNEIPHFFESMENFFMRQKKRAYWMGLPPLLVSIALGIFSMVRLMAEIEEDYDPAIFFGALVVAVLAGIFLGITVGKNRRLQAKGAMLKQFFNLIIDDIHPESGLKGLIDHRPQRKEHIYKKKTSPNSGAKKEYFKYTWCKFKFTLVDGSFIRITLKDKIKTKSGTIIRFIEIQKGDIHFNQLLYQGSQGAQMVTFRKEISNADFKPENAKKLGIKMAQECKQGFKRLSVNKQALPKAEVPIPEKKEAKSGPSKYRQYLANSALPQMTYDAKDEKQIRIQYAPDAKTEAMSILLEYHEDEGEAYLALKTQVSGASIEQAEQMLRANPALAYGRFAIETLEGNQPQMILTKTLLLDDLDPEELETAISGLARLGSTLSQLKELPNKAKRYKTGIRDRVAERQILKKALRGLQADIEESDQKFKVTVKLPDNRQQKVHVRFDRQDIDGNQLISILSMCGPADPQRFNTCLAENSHLSYGALGVAKLGYQDMFVVSDTQLVATVDPKELKTAILHVAQKGDRLEKELTGQDLF